MFSSRSCTARMPAPNKSVPENAEDDHHRHHLKNGRALVGIEHLGENEEKNEREKIIEEEDGPVPARQL